MTCFDEEPNWDESTEARYEEQREKFSSGMCGECKNDAALPDDPDGFCQTCALEAERALSNLDDAA